MKRLICIVVFLLLLSAAAVSAQETAPGFANPSYSPDFIEEQENKLFQLDTLFPKLLLNNTFDWQSDPEHMQYDGFIFSVRDRKGREEIAINANRIQNEVEYNRGLNLFETTGAYANFYFRIDVQSLEQDDDAGGYCWFQYTDAALVGEERRSSVTLRFPVAVDMYTSTPSGRVTTTLYDLSGYGMDSDVHTLEMIRLDGYTSVYIDRHFIVGFEDGLDGRFSHLYGVSLNPGGEYTTFAFDNFIIRRQ